MKLHFSLFQKKFVFPALPFDLVVKMDVPGALLSQHLKDAYESGNVRKINNWWYSGE